MVLTSRPIDPIAPAEFKKSPQDRQVVERLSDALHSARAAVERAGRGEQDAFKRAVEHGVSANLCEALAELAEGVSSFDIAFRWAITRPSKYSCGPVAFSDGDAPILREAASRIRKIKPARAV